MEDLHPLLLLLFLLYSPPPPLFPSLLSHVVRNQLRDDLRVGQGARVPQFLHLDRLARGRHLAENASHHLFLCGGWVGGWVGGLIGWLDG